MPITVETKNIDLPDTARATTTLLVGAYTVAIVLESLASDTLEGARSYGLRVRVTKDGH